MTVPKKPSPGSEGPADPSPAGKPEQPQLLDLSFGPDELFDDEPGSVRRLKRTTTAELDSRLFGDLGGAPRDPSGAHALDAYAIAPPETEQPSEAEARPEATTVPEDPLADAPQQPVGAFAIGALDDAEVDAVAVFYPEGGKQPAEGANRPAPAAAATDGSELGDGLGQPETQLSVDAIDDAEIDAVEVFYPEGGKPPPPRPEPSGSPAQLRAPQARAPQAHPGAQAGAPLSATALEAVDVAQAAATRFLTPERRHRLAFQASVGLQATLALALVGQLVAPALLPSLTEVWITGSLRGVPIGALPMTAYLLAALPWLLYGAMHAASVVVLRGVDPCLAIRPSTAFLDAALPLANVPGSYSLFSQAADLIQLSSGRTRSGARIRALTIAASAATLVELIVRVAVTQVPGASWGTAAVAAAALLALAAQLALLFSFHRGFRALPRVPAAAPEDGAAAPVAPRPARRLLRGVSIAVLLAACALLAFRAHALCPSGARVSIERGERQVSFTCLDGHGSEHGRKLVLDAQGRASLEQHFVAGKLDGPYTAWFADGAVREQGAYRDGVRHGEWSFYSESGRRLRLEPYSNGSLHGTAVLDSDAGREEIAYQSGKRHGLSKKYDASGKLIGWELWTEDRKEAAGDAQARQPSAPGAATPVAETPKAVVPTEMLFGGRTIDWWRNRLATLETRKDEKGQRVYALTVKRLEANGLKLEKSNDGTRVVPSEAVLERCAERGGK